MLVKMLIVSSLLIIAGSFGMREHKDRWCNIYDGVKCLNLIKPEVENKYCGMQAK